MGKHPFVGSDQVLVILVKTARCGSETGLTDSPPTRCVSNNAHYTISLEFSAGHSKKCTNTVSVQIAAKNLLVCPGLPVESEERYVCVWQLNVDGCIWIGRGGREGRRESMRDLGKRRRHGLDGWKDRFKLMSLFDIINILLIVVWVDERRLVCACHSLCVCVCLCVLFNRR